MNTSFKCEFFTCCHATYSFSQEHAYKIADISNTPDQDHAQREAFGAAIHEVGDDLGKAAYAHAKHGDQPQHKGRQVFGTAYAVTKRLCPICTAWITRYTHAVDYHDNEMLCLVVIPALSALVASPWQALFGYNVDRQHNTSHSAP